MVAAFNLDPVYDCPPEGFAVKSSRIQEDERRHIVKWHSTEVALSVKRWQFWLGILVSIVFLYPSLKGLHLDEVWRYLATAKYWWIIPGVLVYFVGVGIRTWRWHYMLRPLRSIPMRSLFPIVCIGYFGNNIYPARAGEILRAYVLKRKENVAISASLATILVERIFDGLVMLLFVALALPFAPSLAGYRRFIILLSVAFLVALAVFFWAAIQPHVIRQVYGALAERFLPTKIRTSLDDIVERFLEGIHFLRRPQDVLMIFLTSVFVWLAETVKYWFVMHAFPFTVPFIVLMLMNGIVNLATTLPAAPGYVGTFDTPGIAVLVTFGVDQDLATGYTWVLHAALWLPITLLGAYYMWREHLRWQDIEKAERLANVATETL